MNAADHTLPRACFPLQDKTPLHCQSVSLQPLPHCGKLILRGDFSALADQPAPRSFVSGPQSSQLYWLGPDELLVTADEENLPALQQQFADYIQTDVSDYYQQLWLADASDQDSPALRHILSQLFHLDFDQFMQGDCQQTQCGQAGVLIARQEDGYLIQYRISYGEYLWEYFEQLMQAA